MSEDPRLILITSYYHSLYANLAKSSLEAAGIYVFLMDENLTNCAPATGVALGGIKLFVPVSEEARARNLLGKDRMHNGVWMRNALPGGRPVIRGFVILYALFNAGVIVYFFGDMVGRMIRGL